MAIDEGHAIHYSAVERGTPVYSSDEVEVGKVEQVVDNYDEHILDGFVDRSSVTARWSSRTPRRSRGPPRRL